MSYPLLSHPNPNLSANRVPSEMELVTLRNIIARSEEMKAEITRQLIEMKEQRTLIHERCDQQRLAFESALSELHLSNGFIETLEEQQNTIQRTLRSLYGLNSAIRRFPFEILERIFKFTVVVAHNEDRAATPREHFVTAIRLTIVCRRWRQIALEVPFLWSHIIVPHTDSVTYRFSDEPFINQLKQRLKDHLPHITVTNVQCEAWAKGSLIPRTLNMFPRINYLEVQIISSGRSLPTILQPIISKPKVEHLLIKRGNATLTERITLIRIPELFSTVISLSISGIDVYYLAGSLPSIVHLYIESPDAVYFDELIYAFPNVENVAISASNGVKKNYFAALATQPRLRWDKLRSFSLRETRSFPWFHLEANSINSVSLYKVDGRPQDFRDFLNRHPSLQHLELRECHSLLAETLENIPPILSLTVSSCDEIARVSQADVHGLSSLSLYQTSRHKSYLAFFEQIVHNICPGGTNTDDITQARVDLVFTLRILVPKDLEIESLEWRMGRLIKRAIREEWYHEERWGEEFNVCQLEWS